MYTTADKPLYDNKVPHLRCEEGDISEVVLLPGDPARVEMFKDFLDEFKIVSSNREYKVGRGLYNGYPITICSTGIGGPSTEIALTELIQLGAKVLIRIGGTGALKEEIACGDFILNTGSVRLGGTSRFYAMPEYPAVADFEIVSLLKETCIEEGENHFLGIGASVGSFYRGQGRDPFDRVDKGTKELYEKFINLNVLNIEMEAETIFTLSSIYGIRAASICTTHCNRIDNKWLIDYAEPQKKMCEIALKTSMKIYDKILK